MEYTILLSLLLLGVCSGKTTEQQNTHDGHTLMNTDMTSATFKYESENRNGAPFRRKMIGMQEKSFGDNPSSIFGKFDKGLQREMTNVRDTDEYMKPDADSQKRDYNNQRSDYDNQKRDTDFQHRDSNYDSRKWDYNTRNWKNSQALKGDNQKEDDYTEDVMKMMKRDESQRMPSDNKIEMAFQGLDELKDYVLQKLDDLIDKIYNSGNSDNQVVTVYSNKLPSFSDPIEIGHVIDKLALASFQYKNVEFYGMGSAYQVSYRVDVRAHQVVLTIPLNDVQIKGQYSVSNLLRHTSGNFYIGLSDNVAYVQTVSYELQDGKAHVRESSGQIQYGNTNTTYENIGFFAQLLQGHLGKILMKTISTKVYEEVNPKLSYQLQRQIEEVSQNLHRAQLVSLLQEGINSIFYGIREKLASNGNASIELKNDNPHEYHYQQLNAKIQSVTLTNIQNISLVKNHVMYTDTMVHALVNLEVSNATAFAVISYQNGHDAQYQDLHVQYTVRYIGAELELHKELDVGQIQLLAVGVHVNHIQEAPFQGHLEEPLDGLVHYLATQLQSYISHALRTFLKSEISGVLAKEKPSYRNQQQN